MKSRRGKFWPVNQLAAALEVSPASIVASAKIVGKPIVGGAIWFPARPHRIFIGEAHRAHLANQRQQARLAESADVSHGQACG